MADTSINYDFNKFAVEFLELHINNKHKWDADKRFILSGICLNFV